MKMKEVDAKLYFKSTYLFLSTSLFNCEKKMMDKFECVKTGLGFIAECTQYLVSAYKGFTAHSRLHPQSLV